MFPSTTEQTIRTLLHLALVESSTEAVLITGRWTHNFNNAERFVQLDVPTRLFLQRKFLVTSSQVVQQIYSSIFADADQWSLTV
jgi:hypothetical protein